MGKVDDLACVQGKDVRALIPEPMLLVGTFQSLEPTIFNSEGVAIFEESFAGGHHALTVGNGATHGEPIPRGEVEGGAGEEFDGILAKPLIGVDAENGGPSLVPSRTQADALSLAGVGVVEEIDVFADAQFVFGVFTQTCETGSRILYFANRIEESVDIPSELPDVRPNNASTRARRDRISGSEGEIFLAWSRSRRLRIVLLPEEDVGKGSQNLGIIWEFIEDKSVFASPSDQRPFQASNRPCQP